MSHTPFEEEVGDVFVLTLSCPERAGIVHAVAEFLGNGDFTIVEHQQFDDTVRKRLYLRTQFSGAVGLSAQQLSDRFGPIAERFGMEFNIADKTRPRIMVMVSRAGHCLNDLIFRWRSAILSSIAEPRHTVLRASASIAA